MGVVFFFSFLEGKEVIWVIMNKCPELRSSKIGAEGKALGRQDCEAGQKHMIKIQHGKTAGEAWPSIFMHKHKRNQKIPNVKYNTFLSITGASFDIFTPFADSNQSWEGFGLSTYSM